MIKVPHISTFQINNRYKSDNPANEAWDRIARFGSLNYLKKIFTSEKSEDIILKLLNYSSTRINQAIELRLSYSNQSLLTSPLLYYYTMLNLLRGMIPLTFEMEAEKGHGLKLFQFR
ncbi:hypothetical protein EHQ59_17030 [Leptospira kemamanensis]|uniref:Uncharacterized protein n=1 Tax=Leptospira kemamanensis TaxID=2484942 RepID=A0A4R9JKI0_9LEPT|nr:hypothetical protein [Leptospira kemamanensis]TGL46740.1 hypothetical protein EHQ59_17030 [Leptospira kemamanensis]